VESSLLHCGIDHISKEGTFCFRPALLNQRRKRAYDPLVPRMCQILSLHRHDIVHHCVGAVRGPAPYRREHGRSALTGVVLHFGHWAFPATGHRSKSRPKPRLGGALAEALGEASQDNFAIKGAIINLAASLARYIRMDGDSGNVSV
jgi:hypothetical protein